MGIEVRAFNLSIWEAEVGGSGVRFQPGNMRLSEKREERAKGGEEGIREGGGKEEGKGKKRVTTSIPPVTSFVLSFLLKRNVINS